MYNIAVCSDCGIGVPFDWIVSHLGDKHGINTTLAKIQEQLDIEEATMSSSEVAQWLSETWVLGRAIENVAVTKGLSCNLCQYCSKTKKVMKNHFIKEHQRVEGAGK